MRLPKRPLFLGMLAEDAWSGQEPERQVHHLYGKYSRRKLHYDRWSMAAGGAARRPSAIVDVLGLDEAGERLLHVMQDVSENMLSANENALPSSMARHPDDTITEVELKRIAEQNSIPFTQVEEVLHSYYRPPGRTLADLSPHLVCFGME